MKLTTSAILAALATGAYAVPSFTNSAFTITQGQPFKLTWSGASGPVTIKVANGPTTNLQVVATIDTNDSGTSFTWTPSGLPSGTYAFEISDSTGTNYSEQWTYQGTGTLTTSATTATSATTSTSAVTTTSGTSTTASTSIVSSTTTKSSSTTSARTSTSSTTSTSTTSSTSSTSSSTSSATAKPSNTNDSPKRHSPLAFVLVAVATLLYFN